MRNSTDNGAGENAGVQGGSVVLDIGGDIGALIVYLPESFQGSEIDVSVADGSAPFTHTGVHPRVAPNGNRRQTAVYPELTTGDYQLWHPVNSKPLGHPVHVEGGSVAELNLVGLASEPVATDRAAEHSHAHTH